MVWWILVFLVTAETLHHGAVETPHQRDSGSPTRTESQDRSQNSVTKLLDRTVEYSRPRVLAACGVLETHHSASLLPGRARAFLENMTNSWKCTPCRKWNKANAAFCPHCGKHWEQVAESYSSTTTSTPWPSRSEQAPWSAQARAWSAPRSPRRPSPRRRGKGKGQANDAAAAKAAGKQAGKPGGTGKGPTVEMTKPTIEALPAAPTATSVPAPKAPSHAAGPPSMEKLQLEALVKCLGGLKETLPPEAVEAIEQLQLSNTQDTTKELHRAVAAQSAAKKQLIQTRAARAAYIAAWNEYIVQVSDLIQKQVQEQAAQLAHYDETEMAWRGSLEKATADLARMANVSTSSAPDEESEMEIAEAQVDNDIEAAQELERRRQQQVADSAKLVEVMASLKESAAQRLAQETSENREGSRTPRRQKQGPIDLTKDKEEKPTNAGQPPLPAQQPQPPAKKPPPGSLIVCPCKFCLREQAAPAMAIYGGVNSAGFAAALGRAADVRCILARQLSISIKGSSSPNNLKDNLCRSTHHRQSDPALQPVRTVSSTAVLPSSISEMATESTLQWATLSQLVRAVPSTALSAENAEAKAVVAHMDGTLTLSDYTVKPAPGHFVELPVAPASKSSPAVRWPSDISYMRAAAVRILPGDLDHSQLTWPMPSLPLALQSASEETGTSRFTVFEAGSRPRLKACGPDWTLQDIIAEAVANALQPVRAVQLIANPIEGLPRPQVTLTYLRAPPLALAVPLDFRRTHGWIITVNLEPTDSLRDLPELGPAGTPRPHELTDQGPLQALMDSSNHRHNSITVPIDRYEWFVPIFGLRELPPAVALDQSHTTSTTTEMRGPNRRNRSPSPAASSSSMPPTLLTGTQLAGQTDECMNSPPQNFRGPVGALVHGTYLEPRSLLRPRPACPNKPPDRTQQRVPALHVEPPWAVTCMQQAAPLHTQDWSGFRTSPDTEGVASLAYYALFDVVGHARIRRAAADWTLSDVFADVLTILPDTTAIRVLVDRLSGLPVLQVVARPRSAGPQESPVPVDLRPSGGVICTLLLPAGNTRQHTLVDIAHRCRFQPTSVVTARGAPFERLPDPAALVEHLQTRGLEAPASLMQAPSTTVTTTAMMSWAGGAPLPLRHQLTVLTRHGPVHGPVLQGCQDLPSQLTPLLTHILAHGHAPQRSSIMLARVMPVVYDGVYNVIVLWSQRQSHQVSVVVDRRLVGGDLDLVETQLGTMPTQVMSADDRRQERHISINGVALPIWRRSLRHGDVVQILHRRISPPVWSAGSTLDFYPEARGITVPMELLDIEQPPDDLGSDDIDAHNIASIQCQIEFFLAGRLNSMGRPGRIMQHVLVQGPTHGDLLLHLELPTSPSVAQLEDFLLGCDFWDRNLIIYDTKHVLGPVSIFATTPPNVRALTALVPSTTVDNLIVVQLDPDRPSLTGHVFWRPHLRPAPVRTLTQGMFVHLRHIDLPIGEGLQLLQVGATLRKTNVEHAPASPSAPPGADSAKDFHEQATPEDCMCRPRVVIPTPGGRRAITAPAIRSANTVPALRPGGNTLSCQGPGPQAVAPPPLDFKPASRPTLAQTVPLPEPGAAWGVNQDIFEAAFDAYRLPIPDLVPQSQHLLPTARRTWGLLHPITKYRTLDAVLIYIDGSYDPRARRAGWSFVAVGKQGTELCRLGALAGLVREPAETVNAFRAEVWALLQAVAFVVANEFRQVTFAVDCQAALDVAFGRAQAATDDPIGLAAQSLLFLARSKGIHVRPLKVEAHKGIPLNEAADAVAKTACSRCPPADFNFEDASLRSCIDDGSIHRMWLATLPSRLSTQLPFVDSRGCWSLPACQLAPSTKAATTAVCDATPSPENWQLHLNIVTYNCLSARSRPARALLDAGLQKCHCALAGFQEARDPDDGISASDHYWIASSACDASGSFGCQIWISKTGEWGRSSALPLRPVRDSFTLFHTEPRVLVLLLRVGCLKVACVSAHAPTAAAGPEASKTWWAHLRAVCNRIPPGHTPLFMVDANAAFEHSGRGNTLESTPATENAQQLSQFCVAAELQPTAQVDRHGHRLVSWTSPDGRTQKLLDYVCVPAAWRTRFHTAPNFCLGDLREGYDHSPIMGTISATVSAPRPCLKPKYSIEALRTEAGQQTAAAALASVPAIPWDVDATTHMEIIFGHVQRFLSHNLPPAPPKPRNPVLSELSLKLVLARRQVRTIKRRLEHNFGRTLLFQCFAAWAGRNRTAQSQARRLLGLSERISRASFSLTALGKAIGDNFRADRAQFTRRAMETARGAGAAEFAHSIRAILRTGRRFRAPQILHQISDGASTAACEEDILALLGKHFAKPERARQQQGRDLLALFDLVRPPAAKVDMTSLPSVADIASATMALMRGKAPGMSGLPAELFQADAFSTAELLFPVLAKSVLRCNGPLQHNGGLARAIPKSKLQASTPAGWRSILLLEPTGKILQKAYRPQLILALEQHKSKNQYGGLPRRRLEEPSVMVRAHFARLKAGRQTGGALFIDSRAAYYSLVRDTLIASCTMQTDEQLRQRARALFPFRDDQDGYVQHMKQGGLIQALQLPEPLVRYLESQLGTTWFAMEAPAHTPYVSGSGTAPGSPIADLLFSFVYARFLRHAEELLLAEGHYVALCAESDPFLMPTWADDTAVLIGPAPPSHLTTSLQRVADIVVRGLSGAGLDPNFGPGKTEAVVHFEGAGSRDAKRQLLCRSEPGTQFHSPTCAEQHLRLVPTYVHLGTVVAHNLSEEPNLLHRAQLLQQIFQPLRMRLLYNGDLTKAEKVRLLEERIFPRFLFGAGLWTPCNSREHDMAVDPLHRAMRQAFRPILGISSTGFSNQEVAAALGLPTAEDCLTQARATTLLHMLRTCSTEVWSGLLMDGHWYQLAWNALRKVADEAWPVALCTANPPPPQTLLPLLPANCSSLCKNYLRVCKKRQPTVALLPRCADAYETPAVTQTAHPALACTCDICGLSFLDARRLAVHKARKHKQRAAGFQLAWGTRCECCSTEFWHVS
ncbi:hypothetical protein AK812_SmicGene6223 [Symbiodinium microadriaticum]|uniref:RNase H type-1 domain-containing protein n=1 Tax=Symbiodinium microadriaticum TaxID=2951 RepID=A0A1Q9ERN4_SYMMI|nr:hypothetical protein AK812_SmicGene6223 [Symbiodinium microadriaticum]